MVDTTVGTTEAIIFMAGPTAQAEGIMVAGFMAEEGMPVGLAAATAAAAADMLVVVAAADTADLVPPKVGMALRAVSNCLGTASVRGATRVLRSPARQSGNGAESHPYLYKDGGSQPWH
jgi:hypothetical protein